MKVREKPTSLFSQLQHLGLTELVGKTTWDGSRYHNFLRPFSKDHQKCATVHPNEYLHVPFPFPKKVQTPWQCQKVQSK